MGILKTGVSFVNSRRAVPPLAGTIKGLEYWFDTALGRQMLAEEKKVLEDCLSCMFGYHLLQLSVNRNVELFHDSRINHCFSFGVGSPTQRSKVGAYSELDSLPLGDESIDVTILHHVLEFSHNPHQVLKEATRVTIPRGYIIVIGFNPVSTMGAIKPFAQLLGGSPIWKRQGLRQSRISDWLQLLDCNTLRTQGGHFHLPMQNQKIIHSPSRINTLLKRWGLPFGNFYCLIARKDKANLIPLRPDWSRHSNLRHAKPAVSARSAARLSLIKRKK